MVLNDQQILAEIAKGLVPKGLDLPVDPYSKDSPVQPSSLDLTVGGVYLPCTEDQNKPGDPVGNADYTLKPGRTAIVLTREEIKMPPGLVAIGFPPSNVSVQGILMTNPGQVDPGYEGPLRFTVINMGSGDFVLYKGKPIVSLVFFQLTGDSIKDWLTRHSGRKGGPITWENLNRVSSDFVNVEARASEIAQRAVDNAEIRTKRLGLWITVIAAIVSGILALLPRLLEPSGWKSEIQRVDKDIATLKTERDVDSYNSRIAALERDLKTMQDQLKPAPQKSNR